MSGLKQATDKKILFWWWESCTTEQSLLQHIPQSLGGVEVWTLRQPIHVWKWYLPLPELIFHKLSPMSPGPKFGLTRPLTFLHRPRVQALLLLLLLSVMLFLTLSIVLIDVMYFIIAVTTNTIIINADMLLKLRMFSVYVAPTVHLSVPGEGSLSFQACILCSNKCNWHYLCVLICTCIFKISEWWLVLKWSLSFRILLQPCFFLEDDGSPPSFQFLRMQLLTQLK